MSSLPRRRLLQAGSTAAAFALAGCFGDSDVFPTDGDERSDDAEDESGDDRPNGDADRYTIVRYSTDRQPEWRDEDESGQLAVFTTEDELRGALALDELPEDRREAVESLIEDTDFEETVLLSVASVGPTTCYDTLEVEELGIEEATLSGRVTAVETSDSDELCGEAITYPSALLRPEFGARPERVAITIVDGWGERETIERPVE
ncbi:MAG: hypothetical protein QXG03_04235 [Halalkalicoccus sp.]